MPQTLAMPVLSRRALLAGAGAVGAAAILAGARPAAGMPSGGTQAGPQITNVFVAPSVREQLLRVVIDYVPGTLPPGAEFVVQVAELDDDPTGLPGTRVAVEATDGEAVVQQLVSMPWANPRLWNVGDPYLYRLFVEMVDAGGAPLAAYPPVRFGFREIWTDGAELVLNGAPLKLRLAPFIGGPEGEGPERSTGAPQMRFYSGMGMNAMEFQPNPSFWSDGCPDGVMQAGSQDVLDLADERGWAVLMPAPSANQIQGPLGDEDEETIAQYLADFQHCAKELDRQNRPSILAWAPAMNTGPVPIDPEELGRHGQQPRWYEVVRELIREQDPTRLVYVHQGERTGDFEMPNFFLNLVPLQEREDWLSAWHAAGEKPWGSAEHGPPTSGNFFRGRLHPSGDGIPYFTEYFAIYLGDSSYASERDAYVDALAEVAQVTLPAQPLRVARPDGRAFQAQGHLERVNELTAYDEFIELFITRTNRAFRAWGANCGLFPWIQDVGFGVPPQHEHLTHRWLDFNYAELDAADEQIEDRPVWANPVYDAYRETMQPLLVFLGGPEARFTAKDHTFVPGEQVEKTIVAVWDGPGPTQLTATWRLLRDGEVLAEGVEEFDLPQGVVERRPIHFTMPAVTERTDLRLELETTGGDHA